MFSGFHIEFQTILEVLLKEVLELIPNIFNDFEIVLENQIFFVF